MGINKLLFWLIIAIIFGMYNMFVFLFGGERTEIFWWAYGATALAFVLLIPAYYIAYGIKTTMRNVFFGTPLMVITSVYIVVQLIAGVVIIGISVIEVRVVVVIQAVILAVFLIMALLAIIGRGMVQRTDAHTKEKVNYLKSLEDYILTLRPYAIDPATQARLDSLGESIRFSDPMSHPSLSDLEQSISRQIGFLAGQLGNPAESGRLFDEISALVEQRNRRCKMLK